MINITFHSLWEAERKENDIIPTHSHNYYELVYYCFGKGETSITKQKFNFKNNNFAIIPPFTEHDEIHFKDAKVICLKFSCSPEFKDIFHFDNSIENNSDMYDEELSSYIVRSLNFMVSY